MAASLAFYPIALATSVIALLCDAWMVGVIVVRGTVLAGVVLGRRLRHAFDRGHAPG